MAVERILEGAAARIDRQHRTLTITQRVKKGGSVQSVSIDFALAPHVSVVSSSRGMRDLAELKVGQNVRVRYVTDPGGKRIANAIMLVEPAMTPGSFSGVQVAG